MPSCMHASCGRPPPPCSIKDMLAKKRMERELLRAKGLLKEAEKPPDEVRMHACKQTSKHGHGPSMGAKHARQTALTPKVVRLAGGSAWPCVGMKMSACRGSRASLRPCA